MSDFLRARALRSKSEDLEIQIQISFFFSHDHASVFFLVRRDRGTRKNDEKKKLVIRLRKKREKRENARKNQGLGEERKKILLSPTQSRNSFPSLSFVCAYERSRKHAQRESESESERERELRKKTS